MADLPDWPYWKVISITGQAGAGTDYQVELEIGDSAGGDFHLEGHCTNFPQDIRITDDDGTTLLDHWVEDLTADPIVVHVEVKDDLGSNQDIRVYYGKSGETTASSIQDTFILGDDFSDGDYTSNPTWTVASGTWSATNNYLEKTATSGWEHINVSQTLDSGIWEFKYYKTTSGSGKPIQIYFMSNTGTPGSDDDYYYYDLGTSIALSKTVNGGNADIHKITYTVSTGWHTVKITRDTLGNMELYLDGTKRLEGINTEVSGSTHFIIRSPLTDVRYDNIRMRKYNSPEPAFSSAGAEQTPTVGAIMNQFQGVNLGADLYNGVFA